MDQPRQIIFKQLSHDKTIRNMAYIHESCSHDEIVFVESDLSKQHNINACQILQEIEDNEKMSKTKKKRSVYENLFEYFANCNKAIFTLSFYEIEKILSFKLCQSVYKYLAIGTEKVLDFFF